MWGFFQFLVMFAVSCAAIYLDWGIGREATGLVALAAAYFATVWLARLIDRLRGVKAPLKQEQPGRIGLHRVERLQQPHEFRRLP